MSDFGDYLRPTARKTYYCEWCGQTIPAGERHHQFKGKWEGEWQNWRMHDECQAAYEAEGAGEFYPGEQERPPHVPTAAEVRAERERLGQLCLKVGVG